MRSEGYSTLSVDAYSATTGYEAAYEQYQRLQNYESQKLNRQKWLRSTYTKILAYLDRTVAVTRGVYSFQCCLNILANLLEQETGSVKTTWRVAQPIK